VHILNAKWILRVSNLRAWYSYPDNIALIIASVFISFLVFFVVQNNFRLRQAKSEHAILAKTAPLTGISNRRHFMEFAQSNMERARRLNEECCILLIDVDKFKNINDIYGHAMGDKVLSEIAARLKALIRPYDLFARYGGEEFIMFISHIKINDAMKFAERLRLELCNKKCEFSDISLAISASFGLAAIGSGNMEDAIKHADEALYKAKEEGRNKVILYEKV
jgi:diguanylate cyclase (GGDEF)-like protein